MPDAYKQQQQPRLPLDVKEHRQHWHDMMKSVMVVEVVVED
jgi:hypothetical protein